MFWQVKLDIVLMHMDILNWFNKKRIITTLVALLATVIFISTISFIVGKQNAKKFSTFKNDNFSIEQRKGYKSAVFDGYKIVLSESGKPEPEGESIRISRNDGGYTKTAFEKLKSNTTTSFESDEPIKSLRS